MARVSVTTNDLLDALMALRPGVPDASWQTVDELLTVARGQDHTISRGGMQRRIQELTNAGKLERLRAPRRDANVGGTQWYFRLKKSP